MTVTSENKAELLMMLNETAAPTGRFTDAELEYVISKAADVYDAAAVAWRMKADKLISAGGLVQAIQTGSESYKFASVADLMQYCEQRAAFYASQSVKAIATAGVMFNTEPADGIGLDIEEDTESDFE